MGILESFIIVFLALFFVGLIISAAIWLMWLFLILAAVLFVVRLIIKLVKKIKRF